MLDNLLLMTDSYKMSHWLQYPKHTTLVSSYIEARTDDTDLGYTVFFGLQAFIKKYLVGKVVTQEKIDEAEEFATAHGEPFNRAGWEYILNEYDGHLPVEIQAVPEGTRMTISNVLAQIQNTDPNCYWLTSYLETALLRSVWYPTTVASVSNKVKRAILAYLEKTGDISGFPFKLHDFGARGVSSSESSMLGGMAHLAAGFMGTDNVEALWGCRKFYHERMAGYSIPASEHSTMTIRGRKGEVEQFRRMLQQFKMNGGVKPSPIIACVSDSYDIFYACREIWGRILKQDIIDSGSLLVVRPDSGDPVTTPIKCIEILAEKFGTTTNSKGYKVLNYVRVIQGDGVCPESILKILELLESKGFSADNLAFGMGGALLQKVDRDTLGFSMKASSTTVDGVTYDVYKQPIGSSWKNSKKGRLALVFEDGKYVTVREDELNGRVNVLRVVFRNGELLVDDSFLVVRKRSSQ